MTAFPLSFCYLEKSRAEVQMLSHPHHLMMQCMLWSVGIPTIHLYPPPPPKASVGGYLCGFVFGLLILYPGSICQCIPLLFSIKYHWETERETLWFQIVLNVVAVKTPNSRWAWRSWFAAKKWGRSRRKWQQTLNSPSSRHFKVCLCVPRTSFLKHVCVAAGMRCFFSSLPCFP